MSLVFIQIADYLHVHIVDWLSNYCKFDRFRLLNLNNVQLIMILIFDLCSVVEECVRLLVAGGFTELKEKDTWKIQPLGKVWDARSTTAIKLLDFRKYIYDRTACFLEAFTVVYILI